MGGELRIAGWFNIGLGVLLLAGLVGDAMGVRHGWPTPGADEALTRVDHGWATAVASMRIAKAEDPVEPASDDPIIAAVADGAAVTDGKGAGAQTTPDVATSMAGTQIWFEREGQPIVVAQPWTIGADVTEAILRDGPGHYPSTAILGSPGNVGIAGHRTTQGAPFWALDDLGLGDEVHLEGPTGRRWIYMVVDQVIVEPDAVWVLDDEVLGTGRQLLTITTCHPRFSASQRLVVWAELVDDVHAIPVLVEQREATQTARPQD